MDTFNPVALLVDAHLYDLDYRGNVQMHVYVIFDMHEMSIILIISAGE